MVQGVVLPHQHSWDPGVILSLGYCLCGVSMHELHVSMRVYSGFSGFLPTQKNMPVGVNECVSGASQPGRTLPNAIPAS